jgi:hypothetical protein
MLSLVVITVLHLGSQANMDSYQWNMVALSSSIPFVNIYIFNIAQSIIAIFLAGDFMKRDKKLDTAEVIYVRPMSNTDYIAGKTWGVIRVFVTLNLVALVIAAFINIFASESAFNPWAYFFYLLTLSIPSLVFVLGVSFLIMNLVKNQAITLILLLGYVIATLVYLGEEAWGAFDFFAVTLPNLFSDVTGHPDLSHYLVQRVSFFLVGTGLLTFTVVLMKRLPQHPRRQVVLNVLGSLLLVVGVAGSVLYVADYRHKDAARAGYVEKYRKYIAPDMGTLTDARVKLQQEGKRIVAQARLTVENQGSVSLQSLLLYLNPSLDVIRLSGVNGEIPFRRDGQVIIVEQTLHPREQVELQVDYSGEVSEEICYLDVSDEEFYNTKTGNSVLRYGKRYAFVGDDFTLLTPESIWYPVVTPPVNPVSLYNVRKDFTRFALQVVNPRQAVVISQGSPRQVGDTLFFDNDQPLPSMSLVMGDYERKAMMLDSLEIALYCFKGHDYFSEDFTHIADTLPSVLRWARDDYEIRKNRDYPFKRLLLVETPISFATYVRNWKGASDYVQPEIVLLPELGATLPNGSFKLAKRRVQEWERRGNRSIEEIDIEMRVVREFIQNALLSENTFTGEGNLFVPNLLNDAPGWSSKLNKYDISPLFFNHVTFIRSDDFPVMDVLMNVMLKQETTTGGGGGWMRQFSGMNDAQRAAEYLMNKSFEQAIMDETMLPEVFYELLKLKATYLKNYILTYRVSQDFAVFMKEFILKRQFSTVSFADLNNEFMESFNINLMDLIPEWYTVNRTPLFIIRGVNSEETTIDDYTRYIISFHVYNPTPVEGILSVRVEGGRGFGGGGFGGFGAFGMSMSMDQPPAQFLIPANSYKKIRVLSDNRPNNLSVGTNIAQNLPSEVGVRLPRMRQITTDTTTGIFNGDSTFFMYDPKEITVDNEDKGFRLIESNQKKHTLQSLLHITTEDRYKNMNFWMPPSRWTATVGNNFHGDYIKSGYYKRAGSGQNMAEWLANISLPGFYDIYVYNSMIEFRGGGGFGGGRNEDEMHQYYKITHADGEDEVSVQTNEDRQTWVPVGSFYFSEGDAKITLVDKGFNPRQLIFADAVRWVYKNNQK